MGPVICQLLADGPLLPLPLGLRRRYDGQKHRNKRSQLTASRSQGKCGAAQVRFSNARQRDDGLAADEAATLTIKGDKGTLASGASDTFFLDGANELACMTTDRPLHVATICQAENEGRRPLLRTHLLNGKGPDIGAFSSESELAFEVR